MIISTLLHGRLPQLQTGFQSWRGTGSCSRYLLCWLSCLWVAEHAHFPWGTSSQCDPGLATHTRILFSWLQCLVGVGTWGSVVKNLPDNAGDTGDAGLIPGLGRSPGEEMATHSRILAWEIPWTEEPGGLHSVGLTAHMQEMQAGPIRTDPETFQEATGSSSPWADAHDGPRENRACKKQSNTDGDRLLLHNFIRAREFSLLLEFWLSGESSGLELQHWFLDQWLPIMKFSLIHGEMRKIRLKAMNFPESYLFNLKNWSCS